jgi:hypothetical protein
VGSEMCIRDSLYRIDAEAIASMADQADGKGALTIQPSSESQTGSP